jgi:hypothetical protein
MQDGDAAARPTTNAIPARGLSLEVVVLDVGNLVDASGTSVDARTGPSLVP